MPIFSKMYVKVYIDNSEIFLKKNIKNPWGLGMEERLKI